MYHTVMVGGNEDIPFFSTKNYLIGLYIRMSNDFDESLTIKLLNAILA
jgi:hypothetical protein